LVCNRWPPSRCTPAMTRGSPRTARGRYALPVLMGASALAPLAASSCVRLSRVPDLSSAGRPDLFALMLGGRGRASRCARQAAATGSPAPCRTVSCCHAPLRAAVFRARGLHSSAQSRKIPFLPPASSTSSRERMYVAGPTCCRPSTSRLGEFRLTRADVESMNKCRA
jgi:hypothetical protein